VVILPPASQVVGRYGSEDALQISFRSQWDEERLVEYYRVVLNREPWNLVSDTKAIDGAAVLYAEQGSRPLWVRIHKAVGAAGSMVEIFGAVTGAGTSPPADTGRVDSTPAPTTGD